MIKPRIHLGRYRHYKGHLYKVIGLARHSETLEWMVIYETLYKNPEGKIWVRPLLMFTEVIEINGKKVQRFKYIGKNSEISPGGSRAKQTEKRI
jgi:hypothetical protein